MNTQGSMFTDVGFSADCKKGTIVAFDESLGMYIPAAAKWSTSYRKDGSVIPETSSYVLGVIVSTVIDNQATVLTSGWSKDEELIQLMTGGLSGEYYLDEGGKAKAGRSNITTLPVYCFSYRKSADSGDVGVLIFNPQAPEYAGHSHGRYILPPPSDWTITATGAFIVIPKSMAVFDALKKGNPDCISLVKNGTELSPDMWDVSIDSDEITLTVHFQIMLGDSEGSLADEFIVHTITPFTAEEPIVRSAEVAKTCKVLKSDLDSGNVKFSIDEDSVVTGRYTGNAVVRWGNSGIYTGPVVQQIHAGPGIEIDSYKDDNDDIVPGSYIVSVEDLNKQEHDMLICNLDGAVMGSSTNANSYVFPRGLTSKIHGSIRVPFIPKVIDPLRGGYADRTVVATINILVKGSTASAASLALTINKIRKPQSAEGTIAYNTFESAISGDLGSDASRVYLLTAEVQVNSCDYLSCTLQANSPTAAIEVMSISLSLI